MKEISSRPGGIEFVIERNYHQYIPCKKISRCQFEVIKETPCVAQFNNHPKKRKINQRQQSS